MASITPATLGLFIGTTVKPEQIGLMFALIFTDCTYYPWARLDGIKWFQIVTLFNPVTYASEGLRASMVPAINGQSLPTLAMDWVMLGLSVTIVAFFMLGVRTFNPRLQSMRVLYRKSTGKYRQSKVHTL